MNEFFNRAWRDLKAALKSSLLQLLVVLAVAGVLGGVLGIRFFAPHPSQRELTRWRNLQNSPNAQIHSNPSLAVYSVPNIKPPHALPTLRDLGDQAQVRAIDMMQKPAGQQARPWDDLRKALTDSDGPGEKDPYLFDRVLVATVNRGDPFLPGDRMVRTQIDITPMNFVFAAYTIAATDTESVKVSSVEASDTRKLPSDIGLTFPGLGEVKVGGLPGSESSVKATSEINSQFEQLGIDIMPKRLRIIRESGVGGDVVGNTRIALSMTTDAVDIFEGPHKRANKPPDEIVLAVTGLNLDAKLPSMDIVPLVPLPHCALLAEVHAKFEQRHILLGREHYEENMHDVEFVTNYFPSKDKQLVSIAGADDVSPFVWSIQLVPPGKQPDNGWGGGTWSALSARTGTNGAMRRIVFSDYGRAVKMAHWVRTHPLNSLASTPTGSPPEKAGHYTFNYSEERYQGEATGYGLAVIKQSGDACRDSTNGPAVETDIVTR